VVKYASAAKVTVDVSKLDGNEVEVADDGAGVRAACMPEDAGGRAGTVV
jgi:signal transduction histidine kinase